MHLPRRTGPRFLSKALSCWRGWHGASRDGCGGDPMRYSDCPVRRYAPHPSALTGCHLLPREKAFCLAGRHLKLGRSHPLSHGQHPMTTPPAQGSQTHRRYCLPPLIRPLRGHLPPREGISQKPSHPTSIPDHSRPLPLRAAFSEWEASSSPKHKKIPAGGNPAGAIIVIYPLTYAQMICFKSSYV